MGEWNVEDRATEADVLYLSFPSLKDPKHDPGVHQRHTGEVVTFVPWESFRKWEGDSRGKRKRVHGVQEIH